MWHTASLVIGAPAWGRSTLQDAGPLETSSLEVSEQPYRGGGLVDLRWVSSGSFRSNDVVSRLYEIILQLAGEMKIVPQGSVGWCLSLPVCQDRRGTEASFLRGGKLLSTSPDFKLASKAGWSFHNLHLILTIFNYKHKLCCSVYHWTKRLMQFQYLLLFS